MQRILVVEDEPDLRKVLSTLFKQAGYTEDLAETGSIACEMLGRSCRSLEIDPRYADVAVNRWQMFTGKKAEGWRGNN